jgi:hypothetical protein
LRGTKQSHYKDSIIDYVNEIASSLEIDKIARYDEEEWIKIHPYNMFCSSGTLCENSGGMIYFVARDFNPLNAK